MKHTLSVVAGAIFLLSGCGYKDDPVPPQTVVPMAIEDLRHEIGDGSVKLTWSYPVKTIKGGSIEEISNFFLYRVGIPLDDYCKNCPIPFGPPQSLPGGPSYDGTQRRVAHFTTEGMKPGYKYFFKVSSRTGWLASSPDSNVVSFVYSLPPAAPAQLEGNTMNGTVNLRWKPVLRLQNGQPLPGPVQYQIVRNGKNLAQPLTETTYSDRQVTNGRKYNYSVQAVMIHSGESVAGSFSNSITIEPKDRIAPKAPKGPRAVTTVEGIKIFWDASQEKDLAEYRVYRRANTEKEYSLLDTVKPVYTIYTDSTANKDTRYYYVVTAVDTAGNESARSKAATTRD